MTQNGKTFNEYLHQAAPSAAVVHFSDRPLKVAGIRITPRWAWSDDYRKLIRHQFAKPEFWPGGQHSAYERWLVKQKLMTLDEARILIRRQQAA